MSSLSIYLICSLWHVFLIRLGVCFASAWFIVNIFDGDNKGIILSLCFRRQNSPYFCVFKYTRAVKPRSGTRLKTESETGRVLCFFFLASHALPISLLLLRKKLNKKPTVLQSPFISVNCFLNIAVELKHETLNVWISLCLHQSKRQIRTQMPSAHHQIC